MRGSCLLFAAALLVACSSSNDGDGSPKAPQTYREGITSNADGLTFATGQFDIPAGKERFLCYATTLQEDTALAEYEYKARPGLHHFVLAQTLEKEPDGFSECNVLFRPTWSPVFIATTADARLELPQGAAHVLTKGTQLLIQLHLLNNTREDIHEQAVVEMKRSKVENPVHAGIYVFGSFDINLPPQQTSSVQASCTTKRDVTFFAMLPHMHYLGKSLKLEAGADDASLKTVFESNPYDFNNQQLTPVNLTLPLGSKTRTTCTYDNSGNEAVTFGESSHNEMCFAIGFALDVNGANGCLSAPTTEYPRDPAAGECKDVVPNDKGVGKPCSKGGGECVAPLQCTADLPTGASSTQGMCIGLSCDSAADCGGGSASCCSLGFTNLCIPEACRPLNCAPR